ncbi:MAG: tetratricopeptide repeat protein [Gemmatimonadota bacterium]|nr:tetratricopeptide repeat protein [Gemmatimonadota bacterium]
MRILETLASTLLVVGLAGCATGGMGSGDPVTRLEEQRQADPTSAPVNRSLGIAYYKADRNAEARTALEAAAKLDPRDGTTALYLGLTDEALGDLPAAKRAYSSYIQFGRTSRVRGQLQSHLAALTRKEITADAKAAVLQEATLSTQPGDPRTVAVMPMRFSGADTNLKVLERGFADLLTTDLARSSQLTLVERSRMQALLDEIRLQQSGGTDAATNVRAGKLLRAGRVVQGAILEVDTTNLRVDAAVVDVPTSQVQGAAQASDLLDQVFSLEKKLALDLFTQLGVTLTVAERTQIEQRPTRSLQAFLAYSRGLLADDQGRYDDAARFFNQAVRLDPGFAVAQAKSEEATAISEGSTVTASTVEAGLRGTSEGAIVAAAQQGSSVSIGTLGTGLGNTLQNAVSDVNPSASGLAASAGTSAGGASQPGAKDAVSQGLGSDKPGGTAKVMIVIKRP